jgi:hypothetical protein
MVIETEARGTRDAEYAKIGKPGKARLLDRGGTLRAT